MYLVLSLSPHQPGFSSSFILAYSPWDVLVLYLCISNLLYVYRVLWWALLFQSKGHFSWTHFISADHSDLNERLINVLIFIILQLKPVLWILIATCELEKVYIRLISVKMTHGCCYLCFSRDTNMFYCLLYFQHLNKFSTFMNFEWTDYSSWGWWLFKLPTTFFWLGGSIFTNKRKSLDVLAVDSEKKA